MSSTLYKNSGLVIKQKTIQVWVPDPPTPYTPPQTGYSPAQSSGPITAHYSFMEGTYYMYNGMRFSSYSAAENYKNSINDRPFHFAPTTTPTIVSPQGSKYYYVLDQYGKPILSMRYR